MQDAFAHGLIELLPRLRRFALSLTRHGEEADDLVQTACERALRSRSQWQEGTRLDAWMFRIIRNLWIDQVRARASRGPSDPLDAVPEPAGEDGREVVESRLTLSAVETAMAALTPEFRDVLVLVCVEGLSYREAADRLDIPIGTVMSRLARARLALSERITTPSPAVLAPLRVA